MNHQPKVETTNQLPLPEISARITKSSSEAAATTTTTTTTTTAMFEMIQLQSHDDDDDDDDDHDHDHDSKHDDDHDHDDNRDDNLSIESMNDNHISRPSKETDAAIISTMFSVPLLKVVALNDDNNNYDNNNYERHTKRRCCCPDMETLESSLTTIFDTMPESFSNGDFAKQIHIVEPGDDFKVQVPCHVMSQYEEPCGNLSNHEMMVQDNVAENENNETTQNQNQEQHHSFPAKEEHMSFVVPLQTKVRMNHCTGTKRGRHSRTRNLALTWNDFEAVVLHLKFSLEN